MESNRLDYDIISIGVGPSSLFALEELADAVKKKELSALCITRGKVAEKGGFLNDCKSNYTPRIGFQLDRVAWDYKDIMLFLGHYYETLKRHVDGPLEFSNPEYKEMLALASCAESYQMELITCQQAHVGTDRALGMATSIQKMLQNKGVEFQYETEVTRFTKEDSGMYKVETPYRTFSCKYLIVGAGRNGSQWLAEQAKELDIPVSSNGLDLGLRIEGLKTWFDPLTNVLYDPKFYLRHEINSEKGPTAITSRTFCTNPGGKVVPDVCKKTGIQGVNGEAYNNHKTDRTNTAIVVSIKHLGDNFDYRSLGIEIAKKTVEGKARRFQRFGDFVARRPTTVEALQRNVVQDGMNNGFVGPGDFHTSYPEYVTEAIQCTIERLGKLNPAIANDDLLLIGPEIKLYDLFFLRKENGVENKVYDGLFLVGDGAGATRAQTSAAYDGYAAARVIKELESLQVRDLTMQVPDKTLEIMLESARLPDKKKEAA